MKTHSNMEIFGKVWPVMTLLLWFIRDARCQTRNCDPKTPVARVCTNDTLVKKRNVYIDTIGVPRFVNITCKCVISSFEKNKTFQFIYSGNTDHTGFKINERYLHRMHKEDIYDTTDLFYITNDSTTASGCLNIFTVNGTKFNITCNQNTTGTTTDPLRPTTSYSSSGITSVTEAEVAQDGETESGTDIIIPIVAATVSVVCIAGVVALVVVCRRRSLADTQKSGKSTTVFEKEKEDEYYMTDNPMYDATDAEPNLQSVEREYHYIESENQDVSMPDCQYESVNDSENEPVLANKVNQNNIENEKVREQESKLTAGDTIYDRTDTDSAKRFLSVNDYDHISSVTSRTLIGIDTYNTCGEAKSKHRENETNGEHSEYHVTSLR